MPHYFFNVELECQIPPLIGTEVRIFLYAELECQILCLVGTEVPIFLGVELECSRSVAIWGWPRFFLRWNWSAELECEVNLALQFL